MHRTDTNHKEITEAFRILGYSVFDASKMGGGFPDIVVGKNGVNYLVEIKTAKGKLNPKQKAFHKKWLGKIYIVKTINEVIEFFV